MTLGQKINNLRKEKNLTQLALGEKIGVSDKTISKWENNTSIPDIIMLNKLVKIFNISYEYLFNENLVDINNLSNNINKENMKNGYLKISFVNSP